MSRRVFRVPPPSPFVGVTVSPGTVYQTITSWEITAQIGEEGEGFADVKDEIVDMLVNVCGINRVRLECKPGIEDTTGTGDDYSMTNDNANPIVRNDAGFIWTALDAKVTNVVLPIKAALAARGETLKVNLCYVYFTASPPASYVHEDPAEYAEFILAIVQHLDATHGLIPDSLEVILEPDVTGVWSAAEIGAAMVEVAAVLATAGYTPDFIAPSSTSMADAITRFDALIAVSGVPALITDFAYHRYSGVSDGNLATIAARGATHGIRTAMLEHINSGVEDLYKDLTIANVSSWQQFTGAFPAGSDDGAQLVLYTVGTPATNVRLGAHARYLAQYFTHVRAGAVRIGAASNDGNVRAVAFRNTTGWQVVVLHIDAAGTYRIFGLAEGIYGVTLTTTALTAADLGDLSIVPGGVAVVSPGAVGVLTIARKA